jgi:hypothetical protein
VLRSDFLTINGELLNSDNQRVVSYNLRPQSAPVLEDDNLSPNPAKANYLRYHTFDAVDHSALSRHELKPFQQRYSPTPRKANYLWYHTSASVEEIDVLQDCLRTPRIALLSGAKSHIFKISLDISFAVSDCTHNRYANTVSSPISNNQRVVSHSLSPQSACILEDDNLSPNPAKANYLRYHTFDAVDHSALSRHELKPFQQHTTVFNTSRLCDARIRKPTTSGIILSPRSSHTNKHNEIAITLH